VIPFAGAPDLSPDDIGTCIMCGNLFYEEDCGSDMCFECRRWYEEEEEDLLSAQSDATYERMSGG
jgi:hypothetical protein